MVLGTFTVDAKVVELDTTRILSDAEKDEYTLTDYFNERLTAFGWDLEVLPVSDGWPDNDDLAVPGVYVEVPEVDRAAVELGSDSHRILALIHIFGKTPAQRSRLAELARKLFERTIPVFDYATGNETSPTATGEYFITDSVGWRKLPSPYTAPDTQQYRALVTAHLRRVE